MRRNFRAALLQADYDQKLAGAQRAKEWLDVVRARAECAADAFLPWQEQAKEALAKKEMEPQFMVSRPI